MMSVKLERIQDIIEAVVRDRLSAVRIDRVGVAEGEDHDGDSALFVSIVFDADLKKMDAARLSGLTRHLRSKLAELGEDRFPYIRFIARSEYEGEAA